MDAELMGHAIDVSAYMLAYKMAINIVTYIEWSV